jgi:hypothetical protein
MNTRNRNALVSALNKMALKDFNSPVEREKADDLLRLLEENNEAEKGGKKTRTPRKTEKPADKPALTAEPGKGIVKKAEEKDDDISL